MIARKRRAAAIGVAENIPLAVDWPAAFFVHGGRMLHDESLRDLWLEHMRRGDFVAAWSISDAVLRRRAGRCNHLPRHERLVWDGRPLERAHVLVRCHHGLGDTIQFARYAPLVRSVATSVTFHVQAALIPLLSSMTAIDRLLPLDDGRPERGCDTEVELMELPHVFRTTVETIPRRVPYLDAERLDLDVMLPPAALRVGLFWRTGDWDDRRAIPARFAKLLAVVRGVQLCMVRRDHAAAASPHVLEIPWDDDIAGTARVMKSLDLVISADSMPAHLAGALGVPVWVLLHADCDWRWMRDRDDSPWYPTMRVFRQRRAGQWREVVEHVARELELLAGRTMQAA